MTQNIIVTVTVLFHCMSVFTQQIKRYNYHQLWCSIGIDSAFICSHSSQLLSFINDQVMISLYQKEF